MVEDGGRWFLVWADFLSWFCDLLFGFWLVGLGVCLVGLDVSALGCLVFVFLL